MKIYKSVFFLSVSILNIELQSQPEYAQTLKLEKDASLYYYAGDATKANTNYGSSTYNRAETWTSSGYTYKYRAIFEFDLSQVPENAVILSANLYLYSIADGTAWKYNSGANISRLRRATVSWSETTVTWNNQPPVTTEGQITIHQSTTNNQNYTLDIKNFVQGWVSGTYPNHGLLFLLQTEVSFRRLIFGSSDNADTTKRPKLEIHYKLPYLITISPQKDARIADQQFFQTNFGSSETFTSSFDASVVPNLLNRSLMEFNLANVPEGAEIFKARLYLYGLDHYGNNSSLLQRITQPWDETTVMWERQPLSTAEQQIILNASGSPSQNYIIDITTFVKNWLDNLYINNGFMLKKQDELTHGRLVFASTDYITDTTKVPRLEILYLYEPIYAAGVQWTDLVNVRSDNGEVRKIAGGTGWNAGACSRNILPANQDGYIYYRYVEDFTGLGAQNRMLGLSDVNTDAGNTSIDYGFFFNAAILQIYESGVLKGSYGNFYHGDEFKICRQGSNIKYYRNGNLLRTITTNPSQQLITDCSIFSQNGFIKGVKTSFDMFPFLVINTEALGNMVTDRMMFGLLTLTGGGINDSFEAGTIHSYWINRILPGSNIVFQLNINADNGNDLLLEFDVNDTYTL
ncbi:MAG: DNRLRE domain-containing protein, partial [Bacteroidia bacterium]|nr:DNRLRE domain-containing protein [Bacteroidia bacterium]